MKSIGLGLVDVLLAGCGADGAPFRPTASGGVSIGSNGVSTNTDVGVTNGALSLDLGQTVQR
jgi:hypothetical protein